MSMALVLRAGRECDVKNPFQVTGKLLEMYTSICLIYLLILLRLTRSVFDGQKWPVLCAAHMNRYLKLLGYLVMSFDVLCLK